jgi:hypothetical protein
MGRECNMHRKLITDLSGKREARDRLRDEGVDGRIM